MVVQSLKKIVRGLNVTLFFSPDILQMLIFVIVVNHIFIHFSDVEKKNVSGDKWCSLFMQILEFWKE